MQRRRGSDGENWKPHLICCVVTFGEGDREFDPFEPLLAGTLT